MNELQKFIEPSFKETCRSCGGALKNRRVRYCSEGCKQSMVRTLDLVSGILGAVLHARFAAFSWTESSILLQVFPEEENKIFYYCSDRLPSTKPAESLREMMYALGRKWWQARDKSKSRVWASKTVLKLSSYTSGSNGFRPDELQFVPPKVDCKSLLCLGISEQDLAAPDRMDRIRNAFRKQVKHAHPDVGGSSASFILVKNAFDSLLKIMNESFWARNEAPFFPGSWVYQGKRGRWYPPSEELDNERYFW